MKSADVVVAGAGILGTAIALELKQRDPSLRILVLDKEETPAFHASGRNSGVIHAGFYYAPGSLKAQMCADGNRTLTEYCETHKIEMLKCGKLVVAKDEADFAMLATLHERGKLNGSVVERVDEKQAREIEPRAKTFGAALWSPKTSVSDPTAVLRKMQAQGSELGIEFHYGHEVIGPKGPRELQTTRETIKYSYFINCAGLQADQVAHRFGVGLDYAILPFKGLYLYSSAEAPKFRTNIYPVPDMRYPFLGVHVTLALSGASKLGPTAIPAFWREQYDGLSRLVVPEMLSILARQLWFLGRNFKQFSKMAVEEFSKYNQSVMVEKANSLATGLSLQDYKKWGRPGIRAQLVNKKAARLEMDFLIEGAQDSLHVLNAVSPGWTCSFPFAKYVCDQVEKSFEKKLSTEPYTIREVEA